ncbi:MAG TPA: hypothetical protein VGM82_20275 [Gemmatimonadaceae bacterium]|jgi:hypothetical protein
MTLESENAAPIKGADEWLNLVDEIFRGLHHDLNNRLGSLSAMVELLQLGDAPADGPAFSTLAGDISRLGEANRMIRLLPRDPGAGEEPLILDDVLADVFAIHRFLHDIRDVQVTIVPTRFVEPIRCERWAILHALVLLLAEAKRLAKDSNAVVRSVTESDEQTLCVRFQIGAPLLAETPASLGVYAENVAATFGGTITRKAGAAELRMPTLKARRASARR